MLQKWRNHARMLKAETYALYLAYRDPRTPRHARWFAVLIVAYAFSPIDLIPDFIPVLGYLDDLILLPVGVAVARRLIPDAVMQDAREEAHKAAKGDWPVNRTMGMIILLIWLVGFVLLIIWLAGVLF